MASRQTIGSTIKQLLLVTLLGLPLLTPLARWGAVPCTHDGHLHVHRVAAIRHAWEGGTFFSRWLPDLAFGYGYPFFVYREPAPLYAVLGPHLLGLPMAAASNLFYALTILAAGWFMFLWVRDVAGPRSGLVSAVAYMAAPYVLLDALVRGNAPESLALPLFPLLLWAGRRWVLHGRFWSFLIGVGGLALLSFSHNISTLIFTPTLLVYLLAVDWSARPGWRTLALRLGLLFGLGLGLAFFYTGGAILEMDQVTLNLSTTTRNNDFRFNFASWAEILAPVAPEDPALLNPPLPIRAGWAILLLAALGALAPLWKRPLRSELRLHVVLMIAGTAVFFFMALPISRGLWENLPLIDFVQFPWRFVGRAALPLAFLAGMPFANSGAALFAGRRWAAQAMLVTAVALLLLEALPALYPRYCEETPFPTIVDVHDYERETGLVGVDPEGSYFPRTVEERPADSPLTEDYRQGQAPQRFDLAALPAGAQAEVQLRPLGATVRVQADQPFTARYLSFAFPGWQAFVDGEAVAIAPSDPEGLITFAVPAGEHLLEVRWGSTPLRGGLVALSLLALAGVVITAVRLARRPGTHDETISTAAVEQEQLPLPWLALVLLAVGLLAFKLLLVDPGYTPLLRATDPPVTYPAALEAAGLRLAGHNLSAAQVPAGGTLDVDLAWMTETPALVNSQSNLWLADADGLVWSEKETYRPRLYEAAPTTAERKGGEWAWDSREISVLPGTPPGTYDLVLTLFDLGTLQPHTLMDAAGVVLGPTTVIGQVEVTSPEEPAQFRPQFPAQVELPQSGLRLLGYNQDRETAVPGESLLLTLFWERLSAPLAEELAVGLRDESGALAHTWGVAPPGDAGWPPGERRRGQHLLRLPASLPGGAYQLRLGETDLGRLMVDAPQRVFEPQPVQLPVGAAFADAAELIGLNITETESGLDVELVWQALAGMDTNFHVFVHGLDAAGQIVAQADGEPGGGTRPVSGWVPGEVVTDRHSLPLSAEAREAVTALRVGLYDSDTGVRLRTAVDDAVLIPLLR